MFFPQKTWCLRFMGFMISVYSTVQYRLYPRLNSALRKEFTDLLPCLGNKRWEFILLMKNCFQECKITFNRPGVAVTVVQIPLWWINSIDSSFSWQSAKHPDILRQCSHPTMSHVLCIVCHVSHVMCHVSHGKKRNVLEFFLLIVCYQQGPPCLVKMLFI